MNIVLLFWVIFLLKSDFLLSVVQFKPAAWVQRQADLHLHLQVYMPIIFTVWQCCLGLVAVGTGNS